MSNDFLAILTSVITWLQETFVPYAEILPLEAFVFLASFLEEIIPPIPAFPLMIMAGSFAHIQDYLLLQILLLALLSALGKTMGAIIIYQVANRLEDLFVIRFGRFFNLKPGQLEKFGAKLGNGPLDYLVMTLLRTFPFVPSALVSIGSGILLIPHRLFLISTFVGTLIRDGLYIYAGYMGTVAITSYTRDTSQTQILIVAMVVLILLLGLAFYYYGQQKKKRLQR